VIEKCARLGTVLGAELTALRAADRVTRLAARRERYRRLGTPGYLHND
jgi:hypothetical protein